MALPARLPEASGDGGIGDPVFARARRAHAGAGRLAQLRPVRGIRAGCRHVHAADTGAAAAGGEPARHRHQPGLRLLSPPQRARPAAGSRARLGVGRAGNPG